MHEQIKDYENAQRQTEAISESQQSDLTDRIKLLETSHDEERAKLQAELKQCQLELTDEKRNSELRG